MSKRGSHNAVLASIFAVAIVGLFFAFSVPLGSDYITFTEMVSPAGPQTIAYAATQLTGKFTAPAAKSYGGAIKGISDTAERAFGGRAVEQPEMNCYVCSCHDVALTAPSRENAEAACMNNCGGMIVSETPGPCR